jgi:hypothetical protein
MLRFRGSNAYMNVPQHYVARPLPSLILLFSIGYVFFLWLFSWYLIVSLKVADKPKRDGVFK